MARLDEIAESIATMSAGKISRLNTRLLLPQHTNNLLFRKS